MEADALPRAVAACLMVAKAHDLSVEDAVVLSDSNRITLHPRPCDVLARVAPRSRRLSAEFEVEVARRLAEADAPVGTLEASVEPRVHEQGHFVVTFWTYYEPTAPRDVAGSSTLRDAYERPQPDGHHEATGPMSWKATFVCSERRWSTTRPAASAA